MNNEGIKICQIYISTTTIVSSRTTTTATFYLIINRKLVTQNRVTLSLTFLIHVLPSFCYKTF